MVRRRPGSPGAPVPLALLAALLVACPQPEVREVTLRLDGDDFEPKREIFHGSVATLGDESRPTAMQPDLVVVGRAKGVKVDEAGFANTRVRLLKFKAQRGSLFKVGVHRGPGPEEGQNDDVLLGHQFLHTARMEDGYTQVQSGGKRLAIRLGPKTTRGAKKVDVVVEALQAGPTRLRSDPFRITRPSRLELEFGLQYPTEIDRWVEVGFGARLTCEGLGTVAELRHTLGFEASGWHDAHFDLAPAKECVLRLSAEGPAEAGAVWGVPRLTAPTLEEAQRPNVVLISLDTLRADHLSSSGYARTTSPALDRELAQRGTSFADTSTTFPLTSHAHMSLFTSLYPEALPQPGSLLRQTPVVTLPEQFRDAGYRTAAFTEDALLAGRLGFWFGFDQLTERAFSARDRGREIFEAGKRYLREHRHDRFFLFLHTYKTHAPYRYGTDYEEFFRDEAASANHRIPAEQRDLLDAYDRSIREADAQLAGFLRELDRLGLAEQTLIVVLSDHGEAFGEHGILGHGLAGHQEQIRVPFVLRGPGVPEGLAIPTPVSLVDVAPTVLELAGVSPPADIQGRSLVPLLRGETLTPTPIFFGWIGNGTGVRLGRWKLFFSDGRTQLFDLSHDPEETTPADDQSIDSLLEILRTHARDAQSRRERLQRPGATDAIEISTKMEESLRALGYLGD